TGGFASVDRRLSQFTAYLQETLDMPVDLFAARDGVALVDAIASGQIEYAIMSGMGYATTQKLCACAMALASPSTVDDQTHIASVLIAPEGIDVASVQAALAGPPSDFATNQVPSTIVQTGSVFAAYDEMTGSTLAPRY
ncbi:MAG: PhnD/SsuA/transferrin family substrate-binding protein, partial [Pseudomonadota bacterium]